MDFSKFIVYWAAALLVALALAANEGIEGMSTISMGLVLIAGFIIGWLGVEKGHNDSDDNK